MTRRIASVSTLFVLICSLVVLRAQTPAPAPATPPDVNGEWSVTLDTPKPSVYRMFIQQTGVKLKGYMANETAEYEMTGSLDGVNAKITWSVYEQGNKVDIAIVGKVDKDSITGTAKIGAHEPVEAWANRTSR